MSCNSLTELKLSTDCAAFTCEDSVLYTKDKSQLVCYPPAKTGAFAVPNGVTEIGSMAFLGSVVTAVTLADSVKKVGDEAFEGAALEEITFGSGLSEIGEYAFNITQLKSVNIGAGVTTIGEGAFCQTKSLSAIEVAEDNPAYRAIDGNLYTKDGGILLQYSAGKEDVSFVLPSGTATIEKFAFVGVACLTDVDLSGVKELKYAAFLDCKALKNVNLGDRLTSIGDSAFSDCAIESLTIPASVTYMGSNICGGSLSSVTFEKTDGWTVEKKIGYEEVISLSSDLLFSPTQACTALQETYRSYIWKNES
jgi:hypothetical protein